MLTAQEVIEKLGLSPHPCEGGFFRETYRAADVLPQPALPSRYAGPRAASTAIYYLLTPSTFSEMHSLVGDELFHFYGGDAVEMLQLRPGGSGELLTLGGDLSLGHRPQVLVPAGVWQGSRLARGSGRSVGWALMGCTVAPGFDYADYRAGRRAELLAEWPSFADTIKALTHG